MRTLYFQLTNARIVMCPTILQIRKKAAFAPFLMVSNLSIKQICRNKTYFSDFEIEIFGVERS